MSAGLGILMFVVVGLAATFTILGVRKSRNEVAIGERLAQFGNRIPTLEEMELQEPFRHRILLPFVRNVSLKLGRFAPNQNVARLRQKLLEAGAPRGLGPTEFMGIRIVLGAGLGGFFLLLFLISGSGLLMTVALPAISLVLGYALPGIWLSRKIKDRKTEITRALPDAIDLLTISVEAGLGFDPALGRVVEKWDNALTREFGRTMSEIRMGSSRRDGLRDLAARVNVEDLNTFISAVVQADQLGVSISQVLRIQSKQMRMRRRQRAEEQAHKAPIKMLIPMVFLIFPSLYIVILGPAVPQLMSGLR
jgi:tight adherence protein C